MKRVSFFHSQKFIPKISQNFSKRFCRQKFLPLCPKVFFFDLFVINLRLSLHWNEYHALFYYKFYSIKILFYSIIILWLYCDITYARINYAVFKLTWFESAVWWKIKFTNDVFSKFFSEKAIVHNTTTKVIPIQF